MTEKSNIILVTVDCLRNDFYKKNESEHEFNNFISNISTYFPNCFSLAHDTGTSFAQFLSSTYIDLIARDQSISPEKVDHNRYRLIRPRISIAETLKAEGYHTYGFQTVPRLSSFYGYDKGFDYYRYFNPMKDRIPGIDKLYKKPSISSKKLNEYIIKKEFREPYFLWIHYNDAHEPYTGKFFPQIFYYLFSWLQSLEKPNVEKLSNLDFPSPNKHVLKIFRRLYKKSIKDLDRNLNELFINSGKFNLSKDLFILTSDHGQFLGEHNLLGHSYTSFHTRELYNVPLYISHPHQKIGNVNDKNVSLLDIVPTISDILNIPLKDRYKGNSLKRTSWNGYDYLVWSNLTDFSENRHSIRIIDEPYIYWRDDYHFKNPKIYEINNDKIKILEDKVLMSKYKSIENKFLIDMKNERLKYKSDKKSMNRKKKQMDSDVLASLKAMGYIE